MVGHCGGLNGGSLCSRWREAGDGQARVKVCVQCSASAVAPILAAVEQHSIALQDLELSDLAKVGIRAFLF